MPIKKLCLFLAVLAVLTALPKDLFATDAEAGPAPAMALPTIHLKVHQRYPLEGVAVQEAEVTPESVATAKRTPEGLLITALAPGTAMLTLHTADKSVQVRLLVSGVEAASEESADGWDHARLELKGLPGLKLGTLGGKMVVQGEILGRQAYQRLLLYLRAFPHKLIVLALPAAGVRESLLEQANTLLAENGLTGVNISNAGHRFFLEGAVESPENLERAFEITQGVIPNIENHLALPIHVDPTITVRVYMLELSRQAHKALGLSWPAFTPQAAVFTPTSAAFSPSWTVGLNHLATSGEARILAEPLLAVKVGASADLAAGGEIPIKITGTFENKVVWKQYGLRIKLKIDGLAGNSIRTRIEASSSQLDEATAVDGVPGIRSTDMSTEVDAQEGHPILLTGLFQASAAKDVEKVPLLGDIPLLGELFKSRRFREHETELLVALVPRIGAPDASLPLSTAHGLDFDVRWRPLD